MSPYASSTTVPVERSQAEIRKLLEAAGATAFQQKEAFGQAAEFTFLLHRRYYRIAVRLPKPTDRLVTHTETGRVRAPTDQKRAFEQEVRRKWRVLVLSLKARFEEVRDEVLTEQDALMPYLLLPSGQTMGEWAETEVTRAYETGEMPSLLPAHEG